MGCWKVFGRRLKCCLFLSFLWKMIKKENSQPHSFIPQPPSASLSWLSLIATVENDVDVSCHHRQRNYNTNKLVPLCRDIKSVVCLVRKWTSAGSPRRTWLNHTITSFPLSNPLKQAVLHICQTKKTQSEQSTRPGRARPTSLSDPIALIKMKMEPGHYQKSHVHLIRKIRSLCACVCVRACVHKGDNINVSCVIPWLESLFLLFEILIEERLRLMGLD